MDPEKIKTLDKSLQLLASILHLLLKVACLTLIVLVFPRDEHHQENFKIIQSAALKLSGIDSFTPEAITKFIEGGKK